MTYANQNTTPASAENYPSLSPENPQQTRPKPPKKTWGEAMRAYLDKRSLYMFFLGFSSGIPLLLIFSSLSLWLREAGVDKATVTMFSWAALGYSFKFIWSPLIDALPVPFLTDRLGRRRAWLLIAQCLVIGAIISMASIDPSQASVLNLMAMATILLGFSAATQDIVVDAYRIELADSSFQSVLSATYNAGYRIGMIVAGAGALYLADFFGSTEKIYNYEAWRNTYYLMAMIMGVGMVTTLTCYEPLATIHEPQKQQNKEKIMGWYAKIALIPLVLVGLVYLLNLLLLTFLGIGSAGLDGLLAKGLMYFLGGCFAILPLAIGYLVLNQPKISNSVREKNTSKNDYLRIVLLFIMTAISFVFGYIYMGDLLSYITDPNQLGVLGKFGFETIHLLLSLIVAIGVGYSLVMARLVKKQVAYDTWIEPIADFFRRYGKSALLLLLLIGFYRVSDIVGGVISNVFYEDMGFSKTDIATAVKLVGVVMVIVGGFLGGLLSQKVRMMQAMMVGAILASATNLMFSWLAMVGHNITVMYMAVVVDNLASGLAGAVFIAFLSSLTNIRFTAVQYAIFSSLMTLFPKVIGGYSGSIVKNIGYENFFILTAVMGVPILLLIYLVDKKIMK